MDKVLVKPETIAWLAPVLTQSKLLQSSQCMDPFRTSLFPGYGEWYFHGYICLMTDLFFFKIELCFCIPPVIPSMLCCLQGTKAAL